MRVILALDFAIAFAAALLLTLLMRRLAARWGFVDVPGGRKKHAEITPQGGGVAIVLACCATILGAAGLAYLSVSRPDLVPLAQAMAEDARRAVRTLPLLLYVMGGGVAVAFFGLWDDLRPFRPVTKLLVQIGIVTVVVLTSGMRVSIFIQADWVRAVVTVGWIVLLTNSFNLLDNMDGLSGSVSFICGGALLVLTLQTQQFFIAGLVLALMGAVLGFLFFNFPPATIFMGDTGSMFLGYVLATATALTTFMTAGRLNPLFPALVPLLIFAVPLYDTVSVVLIRLHFGKHPLAGDRNHLSHRLYRLGMSRRRVLVTIALMTLATAAGATVPYGSSTWRVLIPAVQTVAILCVLVQLELAGSEISYPDRES